MAWIAGVDGCKGGWIAVYEETDSGKLECHVGKWFKDVMTSHAPLAAVAVDMPIGLWKKGGRGCDKAAREVLGERRSSIFPAPAAHVLRLFPNMTPASFREMPREKRDSAYRRATEENRKHTGGKGLSKQSFNLVPKIAEVDRYVRSPADSSGAVHEVHPEVSFAAMNAGDRGFAPMHHYKASMQGLLERRNILAREFGEALEKLEAKALECKGDAASDDFYDALACLWTARRIQEGPEGPARALCGIDNARELDIRKLSEAAPKGTDGLPMRIVY